MAVVPGRKPGPSLLESEDLASTQTTWNAGVHGIVVSSPTKNVVQAQHEMAL